jgi:hypothetical protein
MRFGSHNEPPPMNAWISGIKTGEFDDLAS